MKISITYIYCGEVKRWVKYVPSYFYGLKDFTNEVGNVKVLKEEWI